MKTDTSFFSNKKELLMRFHAVTQGEGVLEYVDHRHPTELEFSMFQQGRGVYTIADIDYDVEPGDIFFVRNNIRHSLTRIDEELHFVNFKFEPRFVWGGNTGFEDNNYLRFIFNRDKVLKTRYEAGSAVTLRMRQILSDIGDECKTKKNDYLSVLRALVVILFVELSRHSDFYEDNKSVQMTVIDTSAISKSMDYINENLDSELTLSDIAAAANLSPNYYCSVFKKLNGVSPWEYITSKRIDQAVFKLHGYSGTILELALSCGFNNTANFNRAFKKCTGMTPMEYKKRLSADTVTR